MRALTAGFLMLTLPLSVECIVRAQAARASDGPDGLQRWAVTREAEPMLTRTTRDHEALPDFVRERSQQAAQAQVAALLEAWPPRQRTRRRRALAGHAVSFATWRSLCVGQALRQRDAVAAMTRLVVDC